MYIYDLYLFKKDHRSHPFHTQIQVGPSDIIDRLFLEDRWEFVRDEEGKFQWARVQNIQELFFENGDDLAWTWWPFDVRRRVGSGVNMLVLWLLLLALRVGLYFLGKEIV